MLGLFAVARLANDAGVFQCRLAAVAVGYDVVDFKCLAERAANLTENPPVNRGAFNRRDLD